MGLFPKKSESICPICGNSFGKMSCAKTKDNIFICLSCNKAAKIPFTMGGSAWFTVDQIRKRINEMNANEEELDRFDITQEVGDYLKIDAGKKLWYIAVGKQKKFKTVHSYSDVIGVELIEDGTTVSSGGLGRAAAGGILFGCVGAIVGGSTGKKKAKNICTELRIKITMSNPDYPVEYIDFISGAEFKKDGFLYKTAVSQARECLSLLQIMLDENKKDIQYSPDNPQISAADEIMKFKQLLDAGVITQEEVDAKKKQLRGL